MKIADNYISSGTLVLALGITMAPPAAQACSLVATAGNDDLICASGTFSGDFLDLNGDNKLTFSAGGSGYIDGNVTFGAGRDAILMYSGTISGALNTGGGEDSIEIHDGTINGNVEQGNGIDDFKMYGGQIQALFQGDAHDTFFMSGGHIVGAFEDGDHAVMTGGRIGRVNMKLDKNYFNMSGGQVDRNVVTGMDQDTIIISGGVIGGNISTSAGDDVVEISGGVVRGDLLLSFGADRFTWSGGDIGGTIDMGEDDDTARIINISAAKAAAAGQILGGNGADSLTFENSKSGGVKDIIGWEKIALEKNSTLNFDGDLVLGDATTGTGALSYDTTSVLSAAGGTFAIKGHNTSQPISVNASGTIDLVGGQATDRFEIWGDYIATDAKIMLETVLGDDGSASDLFVIRQGQASGSTALYLSNLAGEGAVTTGDGILVVSAEAGGTTSTSAFRLGTRVAAGAYEYQLYKGGISAGTEDSWFLRSRAPDPGPVSPQPPAPIPEPVPMRPLPPPPPPELASNLPFYRPEVALSQPIPEGYARLGLAALATFHDRRGEQAFISDISGDARPWVRAFGHDGRGQITSELTPEYDGRIIGLQGGFDLSRSRDGEGLTQIWGILASLSQSDSTVKGGALGYITLGLGNLSLSRLELGAYYHLLDDLGWYADFWASYGKLDGTLRSEYDAHAPLDGHALTLSLESGKTYTAYRDWKIEPQGQIIYQKIDIDATEDAFSSIGFSGHDVFTVRAGARLLQTREYADGENTMFFKFNLWHDFDASGTINFGNTLFRYSYGGTSAEVGVGYDRRLDSGTLISASLDYRNGVHNSHTRELSVNLALNRKF